MIIEELVTKLGVDVESEGVEGLVATAGKAAGVIAVIATAVGTISGTLNKASEAAGRNDVFAKWARGANVTTQALEELQFAAANFGVAPAAVEKWIEGLKDLAEQARIGENDAAAVAFGRLGINVADQRDVDPEELLKLVSEGYGTLAERSRELANQSAGALGFGDVQAQQFLAAGPEEIERRRERARHLRVPASDEVVKISEDFMNAMREVSAVLRGFVNVHLVPTLERLTPWIERFTEAVGAINRMGDPENRVGTEERQRQLVDGANAAIDGVVDDVLGKISELATNMFDFSGATAGAPFNPNDLRNPPGLALFAGGRSDRTSPASRQGASGDASITFNQEIRVDGSADAKAIGREAKSGAMTALDKATQEIHRLNSSVEN